MPRWTPSSSTKSTPWPAPSAAHTWPFRWNGWTRCCPSPPSGSASPPRWSRGNWWPSSWAAPRRWRLSPRPPQKNWDLTVSVPVEDMTELQGAPAAFDRPASGLQPAGVHLAACGGEDRRPGAGQPVHHRVRQLPPPGRTADRAAQRDLGRTPAPGGRRQAGAIRRRGRRTDPGQRRSQARRLHGCRDPRPRTPAHMMAQAGSTAGADPVLARAHHGSVSKDQRALIEDDLKSGRLRCVVATSSLELGIDMGAVDLVVQVESPPSVASGLQRVGRAGHQVGETSQGVLFPKHRADLVHTAITVERMLAGRIERLFIPANPLDILAQQTVAATALGAIDVEEWFATRPPVRALRHAPALRLRGHPGPAGRALPLATNSPSCGPASSGTGNAGTIDGRPGAQRLAVTSGGTIPDRGLFGVYIIGTSEGSASPPGRQEASRPAPRAAAGRRARRGDGLRVPGGRHLRARRHQLEDRGHHARPGAGLAGLRPAGQAPVLEGRFAGPAGGSGPGAGRASSGNCRRADGGPATRAAGQASRAGRLGREQPAGLSHRTAAGHRRRAQRHARWWWSGSTTSSATGGWCCTARSACRCTLRGRWPSAQRLHQRYGLDGSAMAADDGIVLRVPMMEDEPPGAELFLFDPEELEQIVTAEVGGRRPFRLALPRVRRPCAAAAAAEPGQAQPAVAAAPALGSAAGCGAEVPHVSDHPGDGARVPAGCLRPARAEGHCRRPWSAASSGSWRPPRSSPRRSRSRCSSATSRSSSTRATPRWPNAGPPRWPWTPTPAQRAAGPRGAARTAGRQGHRSPTEQELQRLAPDRQVKGVEGVADLLRLLGPLTAGGDRRPRWNRLPGRRAGRADRGADALSREPRRLSRGTASADRRGSPCWPHCSRANRA